MITFKDYTREESEAKYYTMSSHGNYVYSHKEDQKEQIAFEKVYNEVWSFNFPWYYLCNSAYDNFPFDNNQNKTFSLEAWFIFLALKLCTVMKQIYSLESRAARSHLAAKNFKR